MTIAEHAETTGRWQRTLRAPETLDDDLGTVGMWVGPRTGPSKRAQGEKEDYALRRLLVAWKKGGALRFPVELRAGTETAGEPDFVLSWDDGTVRGVEVTEAGEEGYQAWMTRVEPELRRGAVSVPFDDSIEGTVSAVRSAISKKVKRFDRGSYRAAGGCDLLVYDNTAWGGFDDKREILDGLGRREDLLGRFRQVHVVFNSEVWLDIFGERQTVDVSQAYEIDFVRWLSAQSEYLRDGALDRLDVAYLVEELDGLRKSEKRALGSQVRRLLLHLLKWQFQPQRRGRSWRASVDDARIKIEELLTDSPSMGSLLQPGEFLEQEYRRSRRAAIRDTGLTADTIPEDCPYTAAQLVDPEYLSD